MDEQLAKISPEASQTQFYFANLIEEQIKELENESTPETKILVDDTMAQLTKLEINYKKLEQDLINGGNSKLILSAMITNFQTRIDLLQEVMDKIENIKTFKNYDDENITI
jgi:predicted  nucleic acid-binding Zn-ribbon protein